LLAVFVPLSGPDAAAQKVTHWVAPSYAEVQFGLEIKGTCDNRTCNGGIQKLHLWAHLTDVSLVGRTAGGQTHAAFSDNPMREVVLSGRRGAWRMFGHSRGAKAEITLLELCRYYNGQDYETQRITNRNEKFSVVLRTLGGQEAHDLLSPPRPDADSVPVAPLPDEAYFMFEAATPAANPALEAQNSDGSFVWNGFSVIFHVPVDKLTKGEEFGLRVPYSSNNPCEKGEWSIWFRPAKKGK
jgi:hypothetical protein